MHVEDVYLLAGMAEPDIRRSVEEVERTKQGVCLVAHPYINASNQETVLYHLYNLLYWLKNYEMH